jgi:hypothetical protein
MPPTIIIAVSIISNTFIVWIQNKDYKNLCRSL